MRPSLRRVSCALWAALVLVPAQYAGAAGDVVVVRSSDLAPYKAVQEALATGLGQPIREINLTSADGKEQLGVALGEAPALVVAIGPDAGRALATLKAAVPILLALMPSAAKVGLDPKTPLVPMYATPSRTLREITALLPSAKRLGVVYDPAVSKALVDECAVAAASARLTVVREEVGSRQEIANAVRGLVGKVDALWLLPDSTVITADSFKFIMQNALSAKVPVVGFTEGMAKAGALFSVEASYADIGAKAAHAAKRLLAQGSEIGRAHV
jgi:putative tryptophan/tyrosine transport system substrate-binding protein